MSVMHIIKIVKKFAWAHCAWSGIEWWKSRSSIWHVR